MCALLLIIIKRGGRHTCSNKKVEGCMQTKETRRKLDIEKEWAHLEEWVSVVGKRSWIIGGFDEKPDRAINIIILSIIEFIT